MREVSDEAVESSDSDPRPATAPEAPAGARAARGPVLPPRRVLRDEVLLVLFLSLASSALYALVNLLSAPLRGAVAPLYGRGALAYQLLDIGTSLVPVALVAHLLQRSRESLRSIGLDARQPLADLALGALLAVAVGTVGVALYAATVRLGVNRSVVPVPPTGHWWTVPVLLLGALRSGLLEEVIVCGYLLRRLDPGVRPPPGHPGAGPLPLLSTAQRGSHGTWPRRAR